MTLFEEVEKAYKSVWAQEAFPNLTVVEGWGEEEILQRPHAGLHKMFEIFDRFENL